MSRSHPCGTGSVVVDIGGSTGAAIVYTGAELDDQEVEIRSTSAPWLGTHVAVRERRVAGGPRWAAFFGPLSSGQYEVRLKTPHPSGSPVVRFEVLPGRVTSAEWPRR